MERVLICPQVVENDHKLVSSQNDCRTRKLECLVFSDFTQTIYRFVVSKTDQGRKTEGVVNPYLRLKKKDSCTAERSSFLWIYCAIHHKISLRKSSPFCRPKVHVPVLLIPYHTNSFLLYKPFKSRLKIDKVLENNLWTRSASSINRIRINPIFFVSFQNKHTNQDR